MIKYNKDGHTRVREEHSFNKSEAYTESHYYIIEAHR